MITARNRMIKTFSKMMKKKEKILVLYFPIGDTILGDSIAWGQKYFKDGATVLEIGLPYKNPVLDGSMVKDSMARALKNTNLEKVFDTIKEIRQRCPDNILQIMTYYEIVESFGIERFAEICNYCGVDAVLSPNASIENLHRLDIALAKYNIVNMRFAPYHLTDELINDLKENARGYIFLQAVDSTTGMQESVSPRIRENINILKREGISTPIAAGFGISNAGQVKEVLTMGADGIIVGSATVKNLLEGNGEAFIKNMKAAMG